MTDFHIQKWKEGHENRNKNPQSNQNLNPRRKGKIMDTDMAVNAICFAAERVANRIEELVSNIDRPSVIFKPTLSRDGNKWIALFGDDLQVGVVGVGESPSEAMFHFDNEWDKRIKGGDNEN